ncbi:hypothetical protein EYF80_054269 [Liparis tanakae]|uniref:Uncharacterized protein n=1 Tax=Liparis tanakae TaxID=230148 RepID=A0A4Z2F520_9TELE|nr:hypothetical protein EYF80_054269 [Liparis tanakae]
MRSTQCALDGAGDEVGELAPGLSRFCVDWTRRSTGFCLYWSRHRAAWAFGSSSSRSSSCRPLGPSPRLLAAPRDAGRRRGGVTASEVVMGSDVRIAAMWVRAPDERPAAAARSAPPV